MRPLQPLWMGGIRRLWSSRASSQNTAPVVIAGAGPSGLVLGLLLAQHGIKSLILEKSLQPTTHPQAHFINNRTMEVFRHLDGLAEQVQSLSPPLEEWRRFVYCRSMAGEVLGQVDHFHGQTSPCNPAVSPEPVAHLPQSRLLPLLMQRAQKQRGLIDLRMGCTVVGFEQSAQGVEVQVQAQTGSQPQHIPGSFLAAADGASSGIRKLLGIAMEGEPAMQHLINIHFFSPSMGRLAASRPAMLYFVFNAQVVTVLVAHTIQEGEFVAQVPYFPPLQSVSDFDRDACMRLIGAAAGLPDLHDVQIKQIRPWTMTAQVATSFSRDRVFLLGDAAHRFPPAGGFGMNTGVQDAHNLAWKLAAVLQGWAGKGLLDTYEAERKPVAEANTALSVANWNEAIRVPQALGLDPRAANLASRLASTAPLPHMLGKGLLEGALGVGRSLAAASLGPLEAWRKAWLAGILSSGETLKLQFPREDLGFVYRSGALLAEPEAGSNDGGVAAKQQAPARRGAPYVPSSAPGARLPHCWLLDKGEVLRLASAQPNGQQPQGGVAGPSPAAGGIGGVQPEGTLETGQRVSTLDLVAGAAPGLLLLVRCTLQAPGTGVAAGATVRGGGGDAAAEGGRTNGEHVFDGLQWVRAAVEQAQVAPLPLEVVAVLLSGGAASAAAHAAAGSHLGTVSSPSGEQMVLVLREEPLTTAGRGPGAEGAAGTANVRVVWEDQKGGWCAAMGSPTPPDVCLVRADGHVAWRWRWVGGRSQRAEGRQAVGADEAFKHQLMAALEAVCVRGEEV